MCPTSGLQRSQNMTIFCGILNTTWICLTVVQSSWSSAGHSKQLRLVDLNMTCHWSSPFSKVCKRPPKTIHNFVLYKFVCGWGSHTGMCLTEFWQTWFTTDLKHCLKKPTQICLDRCYTGIYIGDIFVWFYPYTDVLSPSPVEIKSTGLLLGWDSNPRPLPF